jgi:hypothetical protein
MREAAPPLQYLDEAGLRERPGMGPRDVLAPIKDPPGRQLTALGPYQG